MFCSTLGDVLGKRREKEEKQHIHSRKSISVVRGHGTAGYLVLGS